MIEKPIRKRRKKSKNYFTKDTENAIVLYNNTESSEVKNEIYEKHIHYPFFKLTQNIIHTYKFYHTEVEDLEHLQHEIIIFLISKMNKFDPTYGAKAYSYFGTIVKRWLIAYDTNNYKKAINTIDTSELYKENSSHDHVYNMNEEKETFNKEGKPVDNLSFFIDKFVEHMEGRLIDLFPQGNDFQIADAVLELFRKRDSLTIFNKKAIYIYIREMVPAETPKITKVINTLYRIFKPAYVRYVETDIIEF